MKESIRLGVSGCDDVSSAESSYEDTDKHSDGMQAPQQEVAFRGSLKPLRAVPVVRRTVARAASCSAEERAPLQLGKAMAAAALAAAMAFGSVDPAKADISGLTPCSESKQFAKRQKNEVKALTKRLGKVSNDDISPSACMHTCLPALLCPCSLCPRDCPQGLRRYSYVQLQILFRGLQTRSSALQCLRQVYKGLRMSFGHARC